MKRMALFFMLITVLVRGSLFAVELVRIKNILNEPNHFRNKIVGLIGIISQLPKEKTEYPAYYFLKDSWGDTIKIATENDLPVIGDLYEVKGVVIVKDNNEIHVAEMARRIKNLKPGLSSSPDSNGNKLMIWVLLGLIALFFIGVVAMLYILLSKKRSEFASFSEEFDTGMSDSNEYSDYIEDNSVYEDDSIKMTPPPYGTLKLLPGRLMIVDGYDVIRDIFFWTEPGQEKSEFTFGRDTAPGNAFWYIQLKSTDVSSKQAKIIWEDGKFLLINYAMPNPTMVNGNPLDKKQSIILEKGDLIKMGEVVFVYYEK